MKKIACLLCGLLLLTACSAPETTPPPDRESTPAPEVTEPAATPTPEAAVPSADPTPETVVPTVTPTPEIVPPEEPTAPTLEEAKALIQQARTALAPFIGEAPTEGEDVFTPNEEQWVRLSGYRSEEEILDGLKAVFTDWLAESFFARYTAYPPDLLRSDEDGVYVRTDARDLLGCYYDMDLDTLEVCEDELFCMINELSFVADGYGNGTPVRWEFGFSVEDGAYQINFYRCEGKEPDDFADDYLTISLDGIPYRIRSDAGSPTWLGEPYRVVEADNGWGRTRTEYYPGLKVELHDEDNWWGTDDGFHPWYIWVTVPGIPTSRGVEVGDTMAQVRAAYPQFDMWGVYEMSFAPAGPAYTLGYPWNCGEFHGDTIYFYFDENLILEEIYYDFDVSQ